MGISPENRRICRLMWLLNRVNEKAVELRDDIGTGTAVAELRARIQNIVEISRSYQDDPVK